MSPVRLNGSTSGYTEIDAPAVAGSNTLTLPTGNGSSGQVLTTNGSGALSWTGMGPAFSAYNNANQTISNSTDTKVILNTEEFDTASAFDSATNYRFTPAVAGYYQLNGIVRPVSSTNLVSAYLSFFKNGAVLVRGTEFYGSISSNNIQIQANYLIYLNGSTDYVELYGYITATSPAFGYAAGHINCRFSGAMVRSA